MLSRVAENLYWLGRYLERAENVSRLLWVASEVSAECEGLDESAAQSIWDTLLHAIPGSQSARLEFSPASGFAVPYISALLLDVNNPVSVHRSLSAARENARVTREAISREVFQNLNTAFRDLERLRRKRVTNPTMALEAVQSTHRAILTTVGATVHTLSRDQGWSFLRLGEAIERSQRTVLVLRAELSHVVAREEQIDIPLLYARRRGLLRSLSCLEAFRRQHGASLAPERVTEFLVFDAEAPRSIRSGVGAIAELLDRLPYGSEMSAADRIVGRLYAELLYDDARILAEPDLLGFLDHAIEQIAHTHEAVVRQYFEG
jgi:uncharacterized alpha-E superfamily protein